MLFLTEQTPTRAESEAVRTRVGSYFGEAQWTDPRAFFGAYYLAVHVPEILDDEWFMKTLCRGDERRWEGPI